MSKKKFLVCGLGRVGCSAADTLDEMYFDVVGIDIDEKVIADIRRNKDYRFMCYVADANDPQFVESLRSVEDFNIAVVVMGDFLTRLRCTKIIKNYARETEREIEVIAWASDLFEESMLWDVGARRFIRVEENLGKYLAYTASSENVLDFNSLRLQETVGVDKVDVDTLQNAYAVMSLSVPKSFQGNNVKDFISEYMEESQKVLAIYSPQKQNQKNIPIFCDSPDFIKQELKPNDTVIISGYHEKLKKLLRNMPK